MAAEFRQPSVRRSRRSRAFWAVAVSTGLYLALVVLLPLTGLFGKAASLDGQTILATLQSERVRAAYRLTFSAAFAAACIDAVAGLLIAWALTRYRFVGRRFFDALVDIPFALPTAVAGIALTALYSINGWVGAPASRWGLQIAFTPLGITLALAFIGLPFVVRSVQPVLADLDPAAEEAARLLGASRWQIFRLVIWPELVPALVSGFSLAFARGLGEYGSVVFIAGNMPMQTEVLPLLIITKLEQYDYAGATVLAASMLFVAFALLWLINAIESRLRAPAPEPAEVT